MSTNSCREASSYNWESFLPFAVAGTLYLAGRCYRVKEAGWGASLVGLAVLTQSKMQKSVGGLKEKRRTDGFWNNTLLTTFTLTMMGLGAVVTNLSVRTQLAAFGALGMLHLGYTYFKHQATTPEVEKTISEIERLSQEINKMTKENIQNMEGELKCFFGTHFRLLMDVEDFKAFNLQFEFFEKSLSLSPEFINNNNAQGHLVTFAQGALIHDKNPTPLIKCIKLLDQYKGRDLDLFSILEAHQHKNAQIQDWMEEGGNEIKQAWGKAK